MMRLIACAVSSSDDTTKSTSSCPPRQSSTYSIFDVRITVVAPSASRRANMPATRLTSSRDVQAMTRSALPTPALARSLRLVPSPSYVMTSNRPAIACSRDASLSSTVISWSSWRASTMVDPTCPAPIRKTFTSAYPTPVAACLEPSATVISCALYRRSRLSSGERCCSELRGRRQVPRVRFARSSMHAASMHPYCSRTRPASHERTTSSSRVAG